MPTPLGSSSLRPSSPIREGYHLLTQFALKSISREEALGKRGGGFPQPLKRRLHNELASGQTALRGVSSSRTRAEPSRQQTPQQCRVTSRGSDTRRPLCLCVHTALHNACLREMRGRTACLGTARYGARLSGLTAGTVSPPTPPFLPPLVPTFRPDPALSRLRKQLPSHTNYVVSLPPHQNQCRS